MSDFTVQGIGSQPMGETTSSSTKTTGNYNPTSDAAWFKNALDDELKRKYVDNSSVSIYNVGHNTGMI